MNRELYVTKDEPNSGLRHRLIHGEYFGPQDEGHYAERIHEQVIRYFNDNLFGQKLVREEVVHPQRHPFGNWEESRFFIRAKGMHRLGLKEVLADLHKNGLDKMQYFEYVDNSSLASDY